MGAIISTKKKLKVAKENNSPPAKSQASQPETQETAVKKDPPVESQASQPQTQETAVKKDVPIESQASIPQTQETAVKKEDCTDVNNSIPVDLSVESGDIKISLKAASQLTPTTPEEMWNIVKQTSTDNVIDIKPTTSRKGWKTIRIFVSSTFRDFHQEREVLLKEVFPDLRLWCESRKLRLVECDLRWGVPKHSTSEDTIKICLSELDRCYEENVAPFFLNLAGDRAGWVPSMEDMSDNIAAQYGWVYGLSVTEMEIVHGAFRMLNPNALFLLRNMEGQSEIPEDSREDFVSDEPALVEKLKSLKSIIKETFPESNVKHYSVQCNKDQSSKKVILHGISGEESDFSKMVYDFFLKRIEELYPLDPSPMDPLQIQKEAHEMFLDSRSSCVLGRDKMLEQIEQYVINGNNTSAPILVVGFAGAGKSAVIAKSAHRATELAADSEIVMQELFYEHYEHKSAVIAKSAHRATELAADSEIVMQGTKKPCKVFFHFVGATPRSTDLASFLQRLSKEMKLNQHEVLSDLDSLINVCFNLLSNPLTDPIIIFVDAVNQMDEDKQQYLNRWLPERLSPNVRVVLSTIESTISHQTIRAFKSSPVEIVCGPLDKTARSAIVENILKTYSKRLHEEEITVLLDKVGSSNPLWLTLACEELRVYGEFDTLINKIHSLPDDLISLEETVFTRFEGETGGDLMKACVCMLEVSRHGLLETELLALLAEEQNVKVPEYTGEDGTELLNIKTLKTTSEATVNIDETKQNIAKMVQETYVKEHAEKESEKDGKKKSGNRKTRKTVNYLPARDWAIIYRNLKPLLRPCGDLGEGRLDFYHRSLSKAVRKKYFSGEDALKQHKYNFWHGVLADFFEGVEDMDRKAEELPYHLEQLVDNNRLIQCLMDWEVFERMYSDEFSIDLLHSWRQCGGYGIASAVYKEQLINLRKSDMPLIDYVEVVEKVYGFLIQAGQYTEALSLMQERLDDEMNRLGKRNDELADVYQNMALCKSEIDKAQQYLSNDQLDDNKLIVEYGRKCLDYRKNLSGADNAYRCALANILISHHLSNVADLTYEREPRSEAFVAIDDAIKVFTELNDVGHLAECMMTKAIIDFGQEFDVREKLLLDSLALCIKGYGEKHLLTTRILLNTGIAYQLVRQYDVAFNYFKKLKATCMAVFGPGHPKSIRAVNTLNEPRYKEMVQQEAKSVPETA